MPDTFLQSLSCPLPEDIAHLKGAGEYELALRLIDRRLAGRLPAMLRARLEAERLFLQRLPRAYTLTEADAVAEMRRSVPDFTAQEWQEYLLDGKLESIEKTAKTAQSAYTDKADRLNAGTDGLLSALSQLQRALGDMTRSVQAAGDALDEKADKEG